MNLFKWAVLFIVILVFFLGSGEAHCLESDKDKHIIASAAITLAAYALIRKSESKTTAALYAIGIALAIGTLKELSDPKFDQNDLAADAIGAIGVTVIIVNF